MPIADRLDRVYLLELNEYEHKALHAFLVAQMTIAAQVAGHPVPRSINFQSLYRKVRGAVPTVRERESVDA